MAIGMIEDTFHAGTNIKVIGVGGGGGNAVDHMIASNVKGVEFICANTDAQALSRSLADKKIQLGETGLGAGSKPEKGRIAAIEAADKIREVIKGAHMLFITAGMGGGTGTGAAPMIAEIARDLGILTVGVITKPFEFEGIKRIQNAEEGINDLKAAVGSLIVVLNDKLLEEYGDDLSQREAFALANDVLRNAVGGIAEIINVPGMINVDFEDVRTVMEETTGQTSMMGIGTASGENRAQEAAARAIESPLLDGVDITGARGVLVNITASDSLKLSETRIVMQEIRKVASQDAHIIMGTVENESMGSDLRVTVVATGLIDHSSAMQQVRLFQPTEIETNPSRQDTAIYQEATGTHDAFSKDVQNLLDEQRNREVPAVWRSPLRATQAGSGGAQIKTMFTDQSAYEDNQVPAFLRKTAD